MCLAGECRKVRVCPVCGRVVAGSVEGNLLRFCDGCPIQCDPTGKERLYIAPCSEECVEEKTRQELKRLLVVIFGGATHLKI